MPLMAMTSPASSRSIVAATGILRRNLRAIRRLQPNTRPANPARIRLRVKAPIQRIVVFRLARRAHGELRHRGLRPVIGNPPRNREARPAIGAVQKRIAIPAVRRIEQLAQAIRAGRRVGRNPGAHLALHLAGDNPESRSRPSPPVRAPQPNRCAPAAESPRAVCSRNASTRAAGPSISMVTPSVSLPMKPARIPPRPAGRQMA